MGSNLYGRKGTVGMASGRGVSLLNPQPEQYYIQDIAHNLSRMCRWGGGVIGPVFTVAQHSVMVAHYCPKEERLAGLLHDGSEAVLGDSVRPLKALLPKYRKIELAHMTAIGLRFGIPSKLSDGVHAADSLLLLAEYRDLRARNDAVCFPGVDVEKEAKPVPLLVPWETHVAYKRFLMLYCQLTDTPIESLTE